MLARSTRGLDLHYNPYNKVTHPNVWRGHNYALQIVRGEINSCIYVKGACIRYLTDIKKKDERWEFVPDKAERYLKIVQQFKHIKGKWKTPNIYYEDWQCFIWMNIEGFRIIETGYRRFRFVHIDVARGNGKAHSLDTPVMTPEGRKLWGDIGVGSKLYDRSGNICNVIGKTEVHFPDAYEMELSDGQIFKVSGEHLWYVQSKTDRVRESRHRRRPPKRDLANTTYGRIVTTREIADNLMIGKESNFSISNTMPVVGHSEVPVAPYVLGYWLGNGKASGSVISCNTEDHAEIESHLGEFYPVSDASREGEIRLLGLMTDLKGLGVFANKHIPEMYFTSSEEYRRELLRGLLDSDGYISKAGQVEFTNKNKDLAYGVCRLASSLGYKATVEEFKVGDNNNFKSDSLFYAVRFTPAGDEPVFRLERKKSLQAGGEGTFTNKRYIVRCDKLEEEIPMFCVEVDSPDNSYLIGDGYVPTHNSAQASGAVLFNLCLDAPQGNKISCVATTKPQAEIVLGDAQAMARGNRAFLNKTGTKVTAEKIVHERSDSEARALAGTADAADGLADILLVLDELHAMKTDTFEVVTTGMSKRFDSLVLAITTAGKDDTSVGYTENHYAKEVCLGKIEDDTRFCIVYTLDKDDNIYDPKVWIKANPNMGVSVDPDTFKSKLMKTLETPRDLPNFKIKHLNMWSTDESEYFDTTNWDKCANPKLRLEDIKHLPCMAAIDLSQYLDLSAKVYVFRDEDKDKYYIWDYIYTPSDMIGSKEVDDRYEQWNKEGWLLAHEGPVIHYPTFGDSFKEDAEDLDILKVGYDPYAATEMAQRLSEDFEMVSFTQNKQNYSEPTKKLDGLLKELKIEHRGSPVMRWCLSNVVVDTDANDNVKPRKSKKDSKKKIDPIQCVIMAIGLWVNEEISENVYEERGILFI